MWRNYLISFTLLISFSSMAGAAIVEAFGDSLTEGIFARTSLEGSNAESMRELLKDSTAFYLTGDKSHLLKHGDKRDAWPSLLAGEMSTLGFEFEVRNFGVAKEKVENLLGQVEKINYTGGKNVRAFFFIGHNDFCKTMDSELDLLISTLMNEYAKAIKEWAKRHVGSKAYLMPVGKINKVYETLSGYQWYKSPEGENFTCDATWRLYFPYCNRFTELLKKGKLTEVLYPRIAKFNLELSRLTDTLSKEDPNNEYHFVKALEDIQYTPGLFALDCFHLSKEGQKTIGKAVFEEFRRTQ